MFGASMECDHISRVKNRKNFFRQIRQKTSNGFLCENYDFERIENSKYRMWCVNQTFIAISISTIAS